MSLNFCPCRGFVSSENVRPHFFSRAESNINLSGIIVVSNQEIFCLDVLGVLCGRYSAILLKGKCTHVVLIDNVVVKAIVLNLGTSLEFNVKVIYHLRVSRDSSVVFSHLASWAIFCRSGKAVGVSL
jgi:hypothetical protein